MEAEAYELFRRIDELGGMVAAIEQNMPQREIADAAYRYQQEVEAEERVVVGVNRYQTETEEEIPILRIDPDLERKQIERLAAFKAGRDSAAVERRIAELAEAASVDDRNLMPVIVDAVRDGVTLGEICDTWRHVWGTWREQPCSRHRRRSTPPGWGGPGVRLESDTKEVVSGVWCPTSCRTPRGCAGSDLSTCTCPIRTTAILSGWRDRARGGSGAIHHVIPKGTVGVRSSRTITNGSRVPRLRRITRELGGCCIQLPHGHASPRRRRDARAESRRRDETLSGAIRVG